MFCQVLEPEPGQDSTKLHRVEAKLHRCHSSDCGKMLASAPQQGRESGRTSEFREAWAGWCCVRLPQGCDAVHDAKIVSSGAVVLRMCERKRELLGMQSLVTFPAMPSRDVGHSLPLNCARWPRVRTKALRHDREAGSRVKELTARRQGAAMSADFAEDSSAQGSNGGRGHHNLALI